MKQTHKNTNKSQNPASAGTQASHQNSSCEITRFKTVFFNRIGQELLFADQEKLGSRVAEFNKISLESASLDEMKGRSIT
jgi:hypothetical protein